MIGDSVACFKRHGREVVYDAEHFFDGWRLDRRVRARDAPRGGGSRRRLVVLCDTNGGELPEVVAERVLELRGHLARAARHPLRTTTRELAVANALAAVRAGCVQVQGTINGYGERCGNLDLVPLIANLQLKLGHRVRAPRSALRRLTEVSHYVAEIANQHPDPHAPYVGTQRVRPQGRHPRRRRRQGPRELPARRAGAVGNSCACRGQRAGRAPERAAPRRRAGARRGRAARAPCSSGSRSWRTGASSSRRPRDRSRCWCAAKDPGLQPAVRAGRLHRHRGEARRRRHPGAGHGQAAGRRRGDAHGGRGRRAGQRARPRGAEGAAPALPRSWPRCTWWTTRCASWTSTWAPPRVRG